MPRTKIRQDVNKNKIGQWYQLSKKTNTREADPMVANKQKPAYYQACQDYYSKSKNGKLKAEPRASK